MEQDSIYSDDLTGEPACENCCRRGVAETGIRGSLPLQLFIDPDT